MIESNKQLIISQKNLIKNYRLSDGKNLNTITKILETKIVDFGINRAMYQRGNLEGTFSVIIFQNIDKIFKEFSREINKIITNEKKIEANEWFLILLIKNIMQLDDKRNNW